MSGGDRWSPKGAQAQSILATDFAKASSPQCLCIPYDN